MSSDLHLVKDGFYSGPKTLAFHLSNQCTSCDAQTIDAKARYDSMDIFTSSFDGY